MTNGDGLLRCPHCGGVDTLKVVKSDVRNATPENYFVLCDWLDGGCGASGGVRRTKAEAIAAWNTRAEDAESEMAQRIQSLELECAKLQEELRKATTDEQFAMAAHDGNLWGKCSECKERQGHYLDAETIRNQQEHIAELTVERDAYFEMVKRVQADCDARDELIYDMWKCLSAHIESAINDGGCGYPYSPQTRGCGEGCTANGEDCSMSLIERRMRELGIEVSE